MATTLIKNAQIVNKGTITKKDLLIKDQRIEKIDNNISSDEHNVIDINGKYLIPGIIDDQVHFREPGLTHKANIATESRAALAGGVTSFMEMPNTKPPALTQEKLEEKYEIAKRTAYTNYSFFMGASNDNLEEVLKTDAHNVCGIKVFMGSSTGNMLVDNPVTLDKLFSETSMLIATHCEDEATIKHNYDQYFTKYGDTLTANHHPLIRDEKGCYLSSSMAIELAKKYNSRLHILHISTAEELDLFRNDIPLKEKRITSEVCVHHLFFSADDYDQLGNRIKCNPAIKAQRHKEALFKALLDDRLDIIATDHAPHTDEEKSRPYTSAPSGLPLVQHALNIMLDFYHKDMISLEKIVEKMCHAPAQCFRVKDRGYIEEGMYADIAIVDVEHEWKVQKDNVLYKCGWSPLEETTFKGRVTDTFVNGYCSYSIGQPIIPGKGSRLEFR